MYIDRDEMPMRDTEARQEGREGGGERGIACDQFYYVSDASTTLERPIAAAVDPDIEQIKNTQYIRQLVTHLVQKSHLEGGGVYPVRLVEAMRHHLPMPEVVQPLQLPPGMNLHQTRKKYINNGWRGRGK